jgi:ubiquinone/menaquinone biosynthesis C-methylase UbiE
MQRVLEPEVMDQEAEVTAYARADFSDSNTLFVRTILESIGRSPRRALDIGCGPGEIPILLAQACTSVDVVAVDASAPMLRIAREAVRKHGLEHRVTLSEQRLPGLVFSRYDFDLIYSKDMLHHIPEPAAFWKEIARLHRQGARDTNVFVVDLCRPESEHDAQRIVETVSANESPLLKKDFYNSLLAAFTPTEIQDQLRAAGLNLGTAQLGPRHFCVSGRLPATASA